MRVSDNNPFEDYPHLYDHTVMSSILLDFFSGVWSVCTVQKLWEKNCWRCKFLIFFKLKSSSPHLTLVSPSSIVIQTY